MILHCLSANPASAAFSDCLRLLREGDCALLLGDGVYGALNGTEVANMLLDTGADVYLLEPHAMAAGILGRIDSRVSVANFDKFAQLTERFQRQQAWY